MLQKIYNKNHSTEVLPCYTGSGVLHQTGIKTIYKTFFLYYTTTTSKSYCSILFRFCSKRSTVCTEANQSNLCGHCGEGHWLQHCDAGGLSMLYLHLNLALVCRLRLLLYVEIDRQSREIVKHNWYFLLVAFCVRWWWQVKYFLWESGFRYRSLFSRFISTFHVCVCSWCRVHPFIHHLT